jgi:hypothetical protein
MCIPYQGRERKLVVTTGKTMITDAVDAATGKWVFSLDQGLQNIVSSIDPVSDKKTYNPQAAPDLSRSHTTLQCPGMNSGKDWPSTAYNPATHMLYIPMAENCLETLPREFGPNDPYRGGGQEFGAARYRADSDGDIGRIDAISLETRKTVWSKRQRATLTSAALVTAGGLLFAATVIAGSGPMTIRRATCFGKCDSTTPLTPSRSATAWAESSILPWRRVWADCKSRFRAVYQMSDQVETSTHEAIAFSAASA